MNEPREPFDPNHDSEPAGFPTFDGAYDAESYANFFATVVPTQLAQWAENATREIEQSKGERGNGIVSRKAIAIPPEMQSFARFSLLPETYNGGVVQWPGIPPEALRKVVRENLAPMVIINTRVDDVLNYSSKSSQPWKQGWQIKLRSQFKTPTGQDLADIDQATAFIEGCNIDKLSARERDATGYKNFTTFLGEIVRDSLTFDTIAIWTDMDLAGRVKAFKAVSGFNIRLCLPQGYLGNREVYAVGVDEAGNVIHQFTRDELIFYHRNARPDADIYGYGYPEIEQTVSLIQAIQNIFEFNAQIFTRNSTPNGILAVRGYNQKQLDILSRIWINLKRGITKSWALPVLPITDKNSIEVIDLSGITGRDVFFPDYLNMATGLFCAMLRFPVRRLGYHISGRARDNKLPETPTTTSPADEPNDPHLGVLLNHIETVLNEYILWTRWPRLNFEFTSKDPKADAREYEMRVLACTVDERRAMNDQDPLESLGQDPDEKQLGRLMGLAPVDPALLGAFQSLITVLYSPTPTAEGGEPGSRMTSKKDPARSQDHGHSSGVRRDSAAESK